MYVTKLVKSMRFESPIDEEIGHLVLSRIVPILE